MFLVLQITFTILAVLCVAAVIPVGALVAWGWGAFCALLAFLFFVFMKLCKTQVEINKLKQGNLPDFHEISTEESENKDKQE